MLSVFASLIFGFAAGQEASDPIADLIHSEPLPVESAIECVGEHRQGAALVCKTVPGAAVSLGDITVTADPDGWVVIGHDRDAAPETSLRVETEGLVYEISIPVEQREYNIQRVEGVPTRFTQPRPPEVQERIRREGAQKATAYRSRWNGAGFANGFVMPLTGTITGIYGSQRYYNGEPGRPHYGIDIAAPSGTPIQAPAGGVVTLAHPDMYFEGGLIFIDHGQGFTSAFLHLKDVHVEVGDVIEQGDEIGTVGADGRSTGPHLDWRIKWHNRYINPDEMTPLQLDALR
jgi:murein DD-endopeptidase MepM/ murein hydrolase activator NlpD